jgi:hypothetical protein
MGIRFQPAIAARLIRHYYTPLYPIFHNAPATSPAEMCAAPPH